MLIEMQKNSKYVWSFAMFLVGNSKLIFIFGAIGRLKLINNK